MDDSDTDLHHDCIIIGAGLLRDSINCTLAHRSQGLYGIAAANAYLSLHPEERLVILESRSCVGGVWSYGIFSTWVKLTSWIAK
jgi:hypothetical protein